MKGIDLTQDGIALASITSYWALQFWKVGNQTELNAPEEISQGLYPNSVAISPTGKQIVVARAPLETDPDTRYIKFFKMPSTGQNQNVAQEQVDYTLTALRV